MPFRRFLLLLPFLTLLAAGRAGAQTPGQAGIVVQYGDGSVVAYCVSFSGDSISGYDALLAAGLDVEAAFDPSLGAAVCRIGPDGCPASDCFCQTPQYWSYWHLQNGAWTYSQAGAGAARLSSGDVDGWRWGQGDPPPVTPFEQICAPAATATPAASPTLPPPTPSPAPTVAPSPTATVTPLPTKTASPTPAPPTATHAPVLPPPVLLVPSDTASPTLTATPTAVPSRTPTATPSGAPSPTATMQVMLLPTRPLPGKSPTASPAPPALPVADAPAPPPENGMGRLGALLVVLGGLLLGLSWRMYRRMGP